MKKRHSSLVLALVALSMSAQYYNMEITLSDSTKQTIPAEMVREVRFVEAGEDPSQNINILTQEYIPDPALRKAIQEQAAAGHDVLTVAEAAAYTGGIVLDTPYVQSFKGIEYLTSLTSLVAEGVFATSLDVSSLTKLEELCISRSKVADLNLGKPESLKIFDIAKSELIGFDLSILPDAMVTIKVDGLEYEILDFSRFSDIETISCAENKLTTLKTAGLSKLKKIIFSTNNLRSASFAGCSSLEYVVGSYNMELTDIDLSGCSGLKSFMFMYTALSSFDTAPCASSLEELNLGWTQITSLSIAGCSNLTYLAVNNTNLSEELDFSGCSNLGTLRVEGTNIPNIDLSACPDIAELQCYEMPALRSLKLADHLTSLFQLNIDTAPLLESFEWGTTDKLQYANIYTTGLKRIDISKVNHDYRNIYLEYNDNLEEIKVWEGFDIANPPASIQKPTNAKFVYEFSID